MARQFLRDLVHCQAFHICPIRISCKMLLSRGCGGAESIPLEADPKKQFVISRLGVKDIRAAISRYDLLIDNNDGTFTSVECESGVLRKGCVLDVPRPSRSYRQSWPYGRAEGRAETEQARRRVRCAVEFVIA